MPFLKVIKAPKTPQKPQEDPLVPDITIRLSQLSLEADTPICCNNPQRGWPGLRSFRDIIDGGVSSGDVDLTLDLKGGLEKRLVALNSKEGGI